MSRALSYGLCAAATVALTVAFVFTALANDIDVSITALEAADGTSVARERHETLTIVALISFALWAALSALDVIVCVHERRAKK